MKEVRQFESIIAEYFNANYAVATDSCTHAIELCLRYCGVYEVTVPTNTYLSVPMTCEKLNLKWTFRNELWENYYTLSPSIIDAAVYWRKNGFIKNTFMCLSFQYKKHLNLGRGGIILMDRDTDYVNLKRMSYDGRSPDVPWADQDISMYGYHYYMTPETALLGIKRFNEIKNVEPKKWSYKDYPDLTKMTVFKNKNV